VVRLATCDLLAVGLNCATGPEFMTDHIRTIHEIAVYAHLLLPQRRPARRGRQVRRDARIARRAARAFADHGWLNIVGGCCGTTPEHIRRHRADGRRQEAARGPPPLPPHAVLRHRSGGGREHNRPLIVGERTNVIGSRLFKNLVAEEKWEEASEIARRQVRNGAHIVDVCLQSSDRDEMATSRLLREADPQDQGAGDDRHHRSGGRRAGAHVLPGQGIINSINLEDGEEKFEKMCPIARAYGAALVVGTIDEDPVQAQAFTRERKLAVAEAQRRAADGKYGIPAEDIVIDPLVFPCATGDENYIGGAVETIEGVRLVKETDPVRQDRARRLEHQLRPAGRRARSGQLGLPLLLHEGRPGPRHRQRGEARALRLDPRDERRLAETCCSTRRPPVPDGHPRAELLREPRPIP
jgi:5-methyltetrahydrofolate--homocysteine methyltransferase